MNNVQNGLHETSDLSEVDINKLKSSTDRQAIIDKFSHPTAKVSRPNPDGEPRTATALPTEALAPFMPIAVVGMATRLPGGVQSPTDFWDMLINKRDGNCEVPGTRYNIDGFHHPVKHHSIKSRNGYFLKEDPALFDAGFFSIPSLEAERMDPQQRMLMEIAWECFESAGEREWRGKRIGCYVGVFGEDWLELACKDTENADRYRAIGTGGFALANRVSYEYDLRGPSITLQTGCSASLIALHEAYGICHTFDEQANGYGRGEAINAVYIKPLSAAIRDKDPIRAVIRATGTNFDGRTPNITSPCPDSQEALVRGTYLRARINEIHKTGLFECHGTATKAGDAVEATVAAELFKGHGVHLGAVKPNVGHSEGASGMTSLIKPILALEHRTIPPNIHFATPNPEIPFEQGQLIIPTEATPWPHDRAERASVNSFGIGGSNAHVIVDSATAFVKRPERTICHERDDSPYLFLISARGTKALQKRIEQIADYANNKSPPCHEDLSHTLAVRRKHLPHRAFAVVRSNAPVDPSAFAQTRAPSKSRLLTMVFTGQGAQWAGMGRDIMRQFDCVRADIETMDGLLQSIFPDYTWTLSEELAVTGNQSRVKEAVMSQPLCTALQIALLNLLTNRYGVRLDSVIGHSSGEIAAAYAAGGLTMKGAIAIAYLRGRAARGLEGSGGMVAVGLGRSAVAPYLNDSLVIACENSPQSVTLAGNNPALEEVMARVQKDHPDTLVRRLRVSIPYHSPYMAQVGEAYETQLRRYVEPPDPDTKMVPMYSTVTKKTIQNAADITPAYWRQNLESPVLFMGAVQSILKDQTQGQGHVFMEIGPHSALQGALQQTFKGANTETAPVYIPSLIRGGDCTDSRVQILNLAGAVHSHGLPMNLGAVVGPGTVLTDIPPYPWRHETRYWLQNRMVTDWRTRSEPHHELLGARVPGTADLEPSWRNLFYREEVSWLEEHVLGGEVIFPGAGYVAMVGEAVRQLHPEEEEEEEEQKGYSIRKMVLKTALVLKERQQTEMVTSLKRVKLNDTMQSDWYAFSIMAHDGEQWTALCHGEVRPRNDHPPLPLHEATKYQRSVDETRWYGVLKSRGLEYGERFQGLKEITTDPEERIASALVTDDREAHESHYPIHPIVIDQCLQAMSIAWANGLSRRLDGMGIPAAIEQLYVKHSSEKMRVAVQVAEFGKGKQFGSATMVDENGDILLSLQQALFVSVDEKALSERGAIPLANQMRWHPDIDLMVVSDLIRPNESTQEYRDALDQGAEAVYLLILRTEQRLREVTPTVPHMVQWKDWITYEATRFRESVHLLTPKQRKFLMQPSAEIDRQLANCKEMYPRGSGFRELAEVAWLIYTNCISLAKGEINAVELLLGGDANMEHVYRMSQANWSGFLRALGHSNPRLRVIEIGAGTGAATGVALDLLRTDEGTRLYSTYHFTDTSPGFISSAQERFKAHDGIEYKVLDISKDPLEQDFPAHAYDLVIASNVLHATPTLHETLRNVAKLLVPNGWLLLDEKSSGVKFIDYVMGTLSGWWLGVDDGRADRPYVEPERWDKELRAAGFTGQLALAHNTEPPYDFAFTMISRLKPGRDESGTLIQPGCVDDVKSKVNQLQRKHGHTPAPRRHSQLPKQIFLLVNNSEQPGAWAQQVAAVFRDAGHDTRWATWKTVPEDDQCIIVLVDVDGPFLYESDEYEYRMCQEFLTRWEQNVTFWVTRAGGEADDPMAVVDPRYALTLGLARCIRAEAEHIFITVEIDKFDARASECLARIYDKVWNDLIHRPDLEPEYEFAILNGEGQISRSHWVPLSAGADHTTDEETPRKLGIGAYGLIDTLEWVTATDEPLGPNDVQIDVRYVGLNFRDVMVAMGVMGDASEFGLEGTGIVRKVGENVQKVQPGDEVGLVATGMFRTRITVNQQCCSLLKSGDQEIDMEGAASMPSVYATAFYIFRHLAQLREGQTVLIHSACGGVGLASIRVCQNLKVRIYATVGTEEKANFLVENIGIPRSHIFNSHDASFLPDLMRETQGRGADVVLNSLAGKLLHASWECVAEFGKMFEIGKRDFLTHGNLAMTPFLKNRTFYGVDLMHLKDADPRLYEELQAEYEEWRREGKIEPIRPIRVFDAVDIVDAFRHMQLGTHMGKILIKMPTSPADIPCAASNPEVSFRSDASYLLVGGLGGVGQAITLWMVERGARHFVFLSRSGGTSPDDQAFLEELDQQNCTSTLVMGSVCNLGDVQRAVSQSQMEGRPLAGVLNLSLVLNDQLFSKMSNADWDSALSPKVQGTWNLHRCLIGLKTLDFLVMFGSQVWCTGNRGSSNYTAANCFVEAFTRYRRQQGLPCSALHLGPVEEVGAVSRDQRLMQRARDFGVRLVQQQELMDSLALAIAQSPISSDQTTLPCSITVGLGTTKPSSDPSVVAPWLQDRRFWIYNGLEGGKELKVLTQNDRIKALVARVEADPSLLDSPETERELTQELGRQITEHMPSAADMDEEQLANMAIDSLMAVEIKSAIKRNVGVDVTLVEIARAGTVRGLSKLAISHLKKKYQEHHEPAKEPGENDEEQGIMGDESEGNV
ncbi:type I polyketide synthase [Aspergillus lucknowensis]|uniref:Polyketide synthase n=1 Tax=Aspergillus lucknowensis TaxID=176173 RepID=A0ABR4LJT8_9EURO